jgi:hypothetical protein
MSKRRIEFQMQVLVEAEDGGEVPIASINYIRNGLLNAFAAAHSVRILSTIVTVDEDGTEEVVAIQPRNNPTEELKREAWH